MNGAKRSNGLNGGSVRQPEGFFSPGTWIWRVHREAGLILAGGRALLMQLAHPMVAAGVAQHSHFRDAPLSRLQRTLALMWSIVFDPAEQARAALEQVRKAHLRVEGVVPEGEPAFGGRPYRALDPELLLWVHATLVDSAIAGYDLFIRPLAAAERASYYRSTIRLAELFEIPRALVPPSLGAFEDYMARMLFGGPVVVGPTARELAIEILAPRPLLLRPAGPLFSLITAGLLPAPLREGYGIRWSAGREKRFRAAVTAVRVFLPLLPAALRVAPNARRAERARAVNR
ncbi:MAG TPA: oxygenase MpaB family protein [candidate division Zixibacteria bacterium]|nr:oxygenase MpaB family protein [candidate division Zixibacteria bacterium]